MKLIYRLKASELDEKWCEEIRSKFPPDALLTITISTVNKSNVDEVLEQAGSIDDTSAIEIKNIIDQEFGHKE